MTNSVLTVKKAYNGLIYAKARINENINKITKTAMNRSCEIISNLQLEKMLRLIKNMCPKRDKIGLQAISLLGGATIVTKNKSIYKNSKSVIPALIEVTKAARPSLIVVGTHSILGFFEVNGLATEASAFDNDMPDKITAPQSLAPSPHIPTKYL
ncbi:hypothetical protein BpHYR1_045069 [Brachionus plicatilis]|uniref:Uncharacterized protein n=1 Tax=Brachionus plicatilis TaxID=10195 RepID=A0A3M7SKS8_BRAPC|nr:hypothetical protein BpHYR1_045069 [Brachionus plicatilis]